MLVEEARVEVEDPLADDVEAEVPGLDDARVDRPDRHLVHAVAHDGGRPGVQVVGVRDQRAVRLVAVERDAVEVAGLPLVPLEGGDEIREAGDRAVGRRAAQQQRPVGRMGEAAHPRAPLSGVRAREERLSRPARSRTRAIASRQRSAVTIVVCSVSSAAPSPITSAAPGDGAHDVRARQCVAQHGQRQQRGDAGHRQERDLPGAAPPARARPDGRPARPSTSTWAIPRNPSARSPAARALTHASPAAKPPERISSSLRKSGRGRHAGEGAQAHADRPASGRSSAARPRGDAAPAGW